MILLSDVNFTFPSSSSPGLSCPTAGAQPSAWSLPSLRDIVAAFRTGASTSSEAVHESQRYTHGHRGHWHSWSHKLSQTRCCLQQHLHPELTKHKPASQLPSSSSAGRDRRSLAQADTWQSLDPQAYKYSPFPTQQPGLLLASYSSLMLTSKHAGSHIHPSCTWYFQVSLDVPAQTAHLTPQLRLKPPSHHLDHPDTC